SESVVRSAHVEPVVQYRLLRRGTDADRRQHAAQCVDGSNRKAHGSVVLQEHQPRRYATAAAPMGDLQRDEHADLQRPRQRAWYADLRCDLERGQLDRAADAVRRAIYVLMLRVRVALSLVLVLSATLLLHAQAGQQPRPADDRDGNRFGASTPADLAVTERGRTLYSSGCAFCHGADARGAQGPDLARSLYVSNDEGGRVLGEFLKAGRPANGMPPFPTLTAGDLGDLSAFLKTRVTAARARPPMDPASIVVGNAMAGAVYFNGAGRCSTCHSPTGDFKGIGAKYNPVVLQGRMINPRVVGGGRGVTVPPPPPATVKVTL